jgi:hypothetical protein
MKLDQMIARVQADNDQDMEQLAEWLREQSTEDLVWFWGIMNRKYDKPHTEVMTRFAILGFAMVAEKVFRPEADDDE